MQELTANAQAERAAQIARKNRWGIMFLMNAGFLDHPLYKNGWWFVPTQDETRLDKRALHRLNTFRDAGVQITQLIVAHQTSNLLPAPPAPPKGDKRRHKRDTTRATRTPESGRRNARGRRHQHGVLFPPVPL